MLKFKHILDFKLWVKIDKLLFTITKCTPDRTSYDDLRNLKRIEPIERPNKPHTSTEAGKFGGNDFIVSPRPPSG